VPGTDVVVIGAGAVGVAVAHALAASGARVSLLERDQVGRGCSYGNAGLVVPGHSLPLATPRALRQGLRWLLTGRGPFSVRARPDPALLIWLVGYLRACRSRVMRASIPALHRLAAASLDRYRRLAEQLSPFHFERRGWLYVYRDPDSLAAALADVAQLQLGPPSSATLGPGEAAAAARAGTRSAKLPPAPAWEALNAAEARRLCPLLSERVVGGIYYPEEAHLHPYAAVSSLARRAGELGVELREGTPVRGLRVAEGRVTGVQLPEETLAVGWVVLAAGAGSPGLLQRFGQASGVRTLRRLGLRLPIQPARGHSLTWERPVNAPDLPLMFGEPHVIATPMGPQLRMTTGLDLVGFRPGLDPGRLQAIRQAAADYLPDLELASEAEAWYGFRPLTPDSRPIIGPLRQMPNLIVAAGHGQLGITLAPITGELVAALIRGDPPPLDPAPFLPSRFGL
jgi:D-amino-acid dehydrogenase